MDEYSHLSLVLWEKVTGELDALAARVAAWEPAPMPEDWR